MKIIELDNELTVYIKGDNTIEFIKGNIDGWHTTLQLSVEEYKEVYDYIKKEIE